MSNQHFFLVKPFENENILFNLILLQIFFTESVCRYRYNNQFTWISKHYLFKQIKFWFSFLYLNNLMVITLIMVIFTININQCCSNVILYIFYKSMVYCSYLNTRTCSCWYVCSEKCSLLLKIFLIKWYLFLKLNKIWSKINLYFLSFFFF